MNQKQSGVLLGVVLLASGLYANYFRMGWAQEEKKVAAIKAECESEKRRASFKEWDVERLTAQNKEYESILRTQVDLVRCAKAERYAKDMRDSFLPTDSRCYPITMTFGDQKYLSIPEPIYRGDEWVLDGAAIRGFFCLKEGLAVNRHPVDGGWGLLAELPPFDVDEFGWVQPRSMTIKNSYFETY